MPLEGIILLCLQNWYFKNVLYLFSMQGSDWVALPNSFNSRIRSASISASAIHHTGIKNIYCQVYKAIFYWPILCLYSLIFLFVKELYSWMSLLLFGPLNRSPNLEIAWKSVTLPCMSLAHMRAYCYDCSAIPGPPPNISIKARAYLHAPKFCLYSARMIYASSDQKSWLYKLK